MSSVWDDPEVEGEETTPLPASAPVFSVEPEKIEAMTAEIIERVVREIVPEIAERLVKQELERLTSEAGE